MIKKSQPAGRQGFTLIEILIVMSIFAIVGVLSSTSLFLTLRGAKKSESAVKVRENINYSFAIIERQIRNAESVDCVTSTPSILNYTAYEGVSSSFSCKSLNSVGYLASGSARLTATDINVTDCTFTCIPSDTGLSSVGINVSAKDSTSSSPENATITAQTEIVTRNY